MAPVVNSIAAKAGRGTAFRNSDVYRPNASVNKASTYRKIVMRARVMIYYIRRYLKRLCSIESGVVRPSMKVTICSSAYRNQDSCRVFCAYSLAKLSSGVVGEGRTCGIGGIMESFSLTPNILAISSCVYPAG